MKKTLIIIVTTLLLGFLSGCSDSKSNSDYLFYFTQNQKSETNFDSEIEETHYIALKNEISTLKLSRTIDSDENNIESTSDCEIFDSFENCISTLTDKGKIKSSVLPYVVKIGNYAILEKEDFIKIRNYITKIENEAFGLLTKEDFDLLLQYGESFKAALKIGEEDILDSDSNSRNIFNNIWHAVNFAISVSVGALLGFGLGYLLTGSLVGAIPTAICFAIGSGIVSYKTGGIAIGYARKD